MADVAGNHVEMMFGVPRERVTVECVGEVGGMVQIRASWNAGDVDSDLARSRGDIRPKTFRGNVTRAERCREEALQRRFEAYAAKFVADRGRGAEATDEALREVFEHCGRPAKVSEYDEIREALRCFSW